MELEQALANIEAVVNRFQTTGTEFRVILLSLETIKRALTAKSIQDQKCQANILDIEKEMKDAE